MDDLKIMDGTAKCVTEGQQVDKESTSERTVKSTAYNAPKTLVFVKFVNSQSPHINLKQYSPTQAQTCGNVPVKLINSNKVRTSPIVIKPYLNTDFGVTNITSGQNISTTGSNMVSVSVNGEKKGYSQVLSNQNIQVKLPVLLISPGIQTQGKIPHDVTSQAMVCNSISNVPPIDLVQEENTIVGVSDVKIKASSNIKTESSLERISNTEVSSVYSDKNLNGIVEECMHSSEHIHANCTFNPSKSTVQTISTTRSVKVETVNQYMTDFQPGYSENDVQCYTEISDEAHLDGYGPNFIAEETEVIAAETVSDEENCHLDNNMSVLGIPDNMVQVIVPDSEQSPLEGNTIHIDESYSSISNQGVVQMVTDSSLDELLIVPDDISPSDVITVTVSDKETGITTDPEVKSEMKRAKDRELKRAKRADPEYRKMERDKALVRMRKLRENQEYRQSERERDRKRRHLSRQHDLVRRHDEREKDKMYKRMRRIRMLQNPMMGIGGIGEEFVCHVDAEDQGSETSTAVMELGGEVAIMDNNILDCLV